MSGVRTITLWAVVIAIGLLLFIKLSEEQDQVEIPLTFLLNQIDEALESGEPQNIRSVEDYDGRLEGEFIHPVNHPELGTIQRFQAKYG